MRMQDPNKIVSVTKNGRTRVQTINEEPTMTQQQYGSDCDVNNIIRRYKTTGEFSHLRTGKTGAYGDFTNVSTFQDMVQSVIDAEDHFMSLPSELRLRFRNDPGLLIEFLQDRSNLDEAIKLGLIDKPPTPAAIPETKTKTKTPKQADPPSDD